MKKFSKNFQELCVENVAKRKTLTIFFLIEAKQFIERLVQKMRVEIVKMFQ